MIGKPLPGQAAPYPQTYIDLIEGNDLIDALENTRIHTQSLYGQVAAEKENFRYVDGKWTIKELLIHLIDTERIFAYRALRFSRMDTAPLPGFDENWYADHCQAEGRNLPDLMDEFEIVRKSSQILFRTMNTAQLDFPGLASGMVYPPRVLGWVLAGHNLHHNRILEERYLSKF